MGRGEEGREEGRGGEERGGEGRGLLVNMMEKKETFTHLVFTYLVLLCMYDDRLAGMHTYVCTYIHVQSTPITLSMFTNNFGESTYYLLSDGLLPHTYVQ